jgi:threonine 3-dehydrogenase
VTSEEGVVKALIKPYGQKGLKFITDAREPVPGPEDVLIKVLAASVCGTDLHIHKSDITIRDRVANNQIIGHEFCGEVVAVGDHVTTLAKGDLVSSESHIICGTCYYCLNGLSRLCQEVSLIGVDRPGGLAEYVVIPAANAFLKSPKISIEVASFLDAYGNAVDTALCVPLAAKSVLVTGCGPQGASRVELWLRPYGRSTPALENVSKT